MVEEQGLRKEEFASANALGVPHIPYFDTSWASKEDLEVNCDFMGEKWSKLQRSCYVKVCYNQSVVFCFLLKSHAAWVESTSCMSAPRGASTRKWDETRELVHDGTQQRRSLNFRFRSTPPIFGHRPQYGSEAAGQWAEERSKCYYQNCHHSRRVGEKWIGLLSERPLSEWAVEWRLITLKYFPKWYF